ncbi:hypothetical protein D6855_04595 [Butyrivibrio sp. CB08]|uniref:PD-(D/E)XK nuclease family transposase n=1 Tax=Butyrivibrio sp. CB08 TaxID=2364879 RepID=UPI000EAAA929|nr:PD-(D/E)XK nuclease family transposase [Butyrivibrio sp. CB08]RKM61181.1 hypothetical protein D6855_04595 [Butyrivibrio sp. CB08]
MNHKETNLANYFPMIRTKEAILEDIRRNDSLQDTFEGWTKDHQKEFLNICSGTKGVKMLYDSFFKECLNPEYDPERLSDLLSELIQCKVKVKEILPNDSTRLGDEMSLVITDIVVELEDGSLANIEVQKLGYLFTGERASCYSADLLLRQYKRLRDLKKSKFSYKDIAPVYTVVFLENSPAIFHEFEESFIHRFTSISDTGIKLNMLQNFIFIPIDIFLKKLHNEGINNKLDAWLAFLGCDEPEYIIQLITKYPEFKRIYDDLYEMCQNTERVIEMWSKELQILDRNTVKYMIDDLQEQLDDAKEQLDSANATIADKDATIATLLEKLQKYESENDSKT